MKVTVQDAGPCRKEIHVSEDAEAVTGDYDGVVAEFRKAALVPGFRKGKAPINVVEGRFADGINEETRDRLVPRLYREALKEKGIVPVAIVGVKDVEFAAETGIEFNVIVDVAPEFKLPKYKRISLKGKKVEVEDKEVDEAVEQMLDRFAKFEDVTDRPVQDADMVSIDYVGEVDGRLVSEIASDCSGLGDGKGFWIMLGQQEFLPGINEELIGVSIGESREIKVHFPDDYHVKEVVSLDATYKIEVKSIRKKVPAVINEELLKNFEVDTEEAMRGKMLEQLQQHAESEEKRRLKGDVAKYLLEKAKLEVPQSIVEQETNLAVRSIVQRSSMQGATQAQIEDQRDHIVTAATESSTERVKLSYILSRIADAESVEVEDSELEEEINRAAPRYRMSPADFRAELEKRNGTEKLKSDIRAEKVLDMLLEKAKIKI